AYGRDRAEPLDHREPAAREAPLELTRERSGVRDVLGRHHEIEAVALRLDAAREHVVVRERAQHVVGAAPARSALAHDAQQILAPGHAGDAVRAELAHPLARATVDALDDRVL